MFKESVKRVLIQEGSALHYVFEQSPASQDSLAWDVFLSKLSKQTVLSDPKLKALLQNMAKTEVKTLAKAVAAIKNSLSEYSFETEQKNPDQDQEGNLLLNFEVKFPETKKKLKFAVKMDNGKPVIEFPEQTRNELNSMADEASKMLRAMLMHAQETVLDNMGDVSQLTLKRDEYLKKLQLEVDKILNKMPMLQIAMLKYVLKRKIQGS